MLINLAERIRENPREDLDDALFYTITRACFLEKEIKVRDSVVENHGKRYLRTFMNTGDGVWTPLRRVLLDFTDKYVMLDGFLLDDIIIEKGFIEELISALDASTMTAVADDISSYETAAAAVTDEALRYYPDIRKWNSEAVLTTPRVAYGDGERAKERLAVAYRNILSKASEAGYKTLSIAPLSDCPLELEGDIAASSASIFFTLRPDAAMAVTFILPDEKSLSRFLSSDHQEE